MTNDLYKEIAENLLDSLPKNWEDVKLYAQLTKSSYEFFFYVKVNGSYIQCFELEKSYLITRKQLRDTFKKLYSIVKPDFEEKKWFAMTFSLTNEGKFNVEYEYTDYTENTLEYKEQWKSKYLKQVL